MDEIEELYLNGIASAKAGNRRLAQAFFKRVIGINAHHEGAWLWLSQVLEDPDDIVYCLDAVLTLNPGNDNARRAKELLQGKRTEPPRPLEWSPLADLRQMDLPAILAQTPPPAKPLPVVVEEEAPLPRTGFQLFWRIGFFTMVLIVLSFSVFLASRPPAAPPADPLPAVTINPDAGQAEERQAIRDYLLKIDPILGPLRLAHDVFIEKSNQRVSVADQIGNTGWLLSHIQAAIAAMEQIDPPAEMEEAHQEYLQGLALEQEGFNNLLSYYETSKTGFSNRASVKFQESRGHLDRAKAIWDAYRQWLGIPEPTRLPTPTIQFTPTYGRPPTITPTIERRTLTPTPWPTQPIG